ncbi:MAG: metal-dependent hydrolase [Halodesulfurarchaeum sp.]
MLRSGHYGAALLAYAPLAWVLLAGGHRVATALALPTILVLARLPDLDRRLPLVRHRGGTHTVWFAGLVGMGVGGLASALCPSPTGESPLGVAGWGFVVGGAAIGSHLLADAITPAGIRPLWPLTDRRIALGFVTADSWIANSLLLWLGFGVAALGVIFGMGSGTWMFWQVVGP